MRRFFIIGNPRSGTTLFRLMLNKHSHITVPPEAGFLAWLYDEYSEFTFSENNVLRFIASLKKTKKIETWSLDFDELYNYILKNKPNKYSKLCDCIYVYYSTIILNKDVLVYGDKNNFYLNKVELLSKLYPDALFIHIVRDGRSVAVSYKDLNKKEISGEYAPELSIEIGDIAKDWTNNLMSIINSFDKLESCKYFTIRFEDLITEPNKVLNKVLKFLKLDFESQMLEYYNTTEEEGLEPKNFLKWKEKNLQPLLVDEVIKYKKLTIPEIKKFEQISSDMLLKYGYIN